MKTKRLLLFLCFVILLLSYACREDNVDKTNIIEPDPITPDLTVKVTSSVAGFVIDESGNPVTFASVSAGDKQVLTDAYGYFKITSTPLAKIAGQVIITKTGYFNGYKTFIPVESKEAFVRVQLLTKNEAGTIDAATGGSASTSDGGTITLPANGVMTAKENETYTGQVHINARIINIADDSNSQLNTPGDARGTTTEGYIKALKSFSMIAVELTGSNGQLLQLMAGKPATISLPIPSALSADAPSTIDLWYFDTTTGLWKQDGTATRTGEAYVGTVTHFSFWSGAEGLSLVNFSAHVVDAGGQPLVNAPVSINIAGLPKNAGHGRFGYTDANGNVTGAVFANADLILDILTPCALSAYSHEFSTAASDVDLGTLTGNLGQNSVTLSGTAKNCDGQPVASGYIQTYDHGFYNRIAVTNGAFTFTGLMCTNTTVNVVVVDNTTYEQNTPQSVSIVPGANNLGTLTACGTSTMGHITYSFDGAPAVQILEPTDTIAAYFTGTSATQIVTLSGEPNTSQKMSFQFDGGTTLGSEHTFIDLFSNIFPSGRGYWPAKITVTITEFGPIGGFVSGEFTANNILDFESNEMHSLTCSFRIRRYN